MATTTTALVKVDDAEVVPAVGALMPVVSIDQMVQRHRTIQDCAGRVMREGLDYGVIPGTERKGEGLISKNLVLFKPGAEKLCTLFGLTPDFQRDEAIIDFDRGLFLFSYRCVLLRGAMQEMNAAGKVVTIGQIVGTGIGSANSREKKYRREARLCPQCGKPAIKRSKYPPRNDQSAAPGWYCFDKAGGCGANFNADDREILGQAAAVDPNEAAELVNTLQKMAQKRSLVAAVLVATNASDMFTQDLEPEDDRPEPPTRQAPPVRQTPPKESQPAPPKGEGGQTNSDGPPHTGNELLGRLQRFEAALVKADLCAPGQLIVHMVQWGQAKGASGVIGDWNDPKILEAAGEEAKAWKASRSDAKKKRGNELANACARLNMTPLEMERLCAEHGFGSLIEAGASEQKTRVLLASLQRMWEESQAEDAEEADAVRQG